MALDVLVDFAYDEELAGYRPCKLEVEDPALVEHLSGVLAEADIAVGVREDLPTLKQVLNRVARDLAGKGPAAWCSGGTGDLCADTRRSPSSW